MRIPFTEIRLFDPSMMAECCSAVNEVISSGEFVLGRQVKNFEQEFAAYLGSQFCIAVNSGTSALQLALHASGIEPGDEVITSPATWISTAWAISYRGAIPVFVDIDPETYTIDPKRVEQAITPRTKALLPVHLYGQCANLDALHEIAKRHELTVIEDAAQAHGAKYRGQRVGTIGKAGCFSFYPSKNLGAFGEGGAVTTNDRELAERIRQLRDHAQSSRHIHVEIGYNARMDGIQGAVLRVKLRYLEAWNAARQRIADKYLKGLSNQSGIVLPSVLHRDGHVWHLFVILARNRDQLQQRLAEKGIETRVHYPTLVPFQPAYIGRGYQRGAFPVAEKLASHCLSLPLYPEMTDESVNYVVAQVKQALL